MLSREDRILSELIVSRGLAKPDVVERRATELSESNESGLAEALLSHGEISPGDARTVRDEAREIDGLLAREIPGGKVLGDYRLVREIGRGGMGIVYEAEQVSLERRVALKVLPAGAALDERLAIRFLREARAAARLRHPGIVPVFAAGHEEGVLFFAMELIDGESLAERLARGKLAPHEAASIALEVASALHHAHEAGLVHRDVKPENIILGRDGRARVADFGLVRELSGSRLTRSQHVLGTPAFCPPEQARGETVDRRGDVYALGAVLYAMLSGRPPYAGEVPAAVLARLLSDSPAPLATLVPDLPERLGGICRRAMARDPARRYPDAAALAQDLEGFLTDEPAPRARIPVVSPLLAILIASALLLVWRMPERPVTIHPDDTSIGFPGVTFDFVPSMPGVIRGAVASPDGRYVAYATLTPFETYVQQGDDVATAWSLGPETSEPAWSPDGERIAFCRGGNLETMQIATRTRARLATGCGAVSWSPDGDSLVFGERLWPTTRLRRIDLEDGRSRLLTGSGVADPAWSPDGRFIAFVAAWESRFDVWTVPAAGGKPIRITDDDAREWLPQWRGSRILFGSDQASEGDFWYVDIDPSTGKPLGAPGRRSFGWAGTRFEARTTLDGRYMVFNHLHDRLLPWVLSLDATAEVAAVPTTVAVNLPLGAGAVRAPGREEWAIEVADGDAIDLEGFGLDSSRLVSLRDDGARNRHPRWSPDGTHVAFVAERDGRADVYTSPADGGEAARVTDRGDVVGPPTWSPDGGRIAWASRDGDVYVTDRARRETTRLTGGLVPGSWSPDGGHLAGVAAGEVVVADLGSGAVTRVGDGRSPVWLDAEVLVFVRGNEVYRWRHGDVPVRVWEAGPNRIDSPLSVDRESRRVFLAARTFADRLVRIDFEGGVGR